jgi:hypothetical protein
VEGGHAVPYRYFLKRRRSGVSLKTLLSRFENKPLKMMALVIVAIVVGRVASEFGMGFVDGVISGFTDGM